MTTTGWAEPDAEVPAMPVSALLMEGVEHRASPLEQALARARADEFRAARDAAASAGDPDERAANLIGRGVMPGMMTDLSRRLADTEAELAAEADKSARGERVTERVRGMLERGQIGGLEASRMLDGDFGDAHRAEQLERRRDLLRQQLAEASAMISPPQERQLSGVEAASRSAHDTFIAVTRAKMAAAQAGRGEPRPFGSRAGFAGRAEAPVCADCLAAGATAEQSYLIHADPDAPAEVRLPVAAGGAVTYLPPGADGPTVGRPVTFPDDDR